MDTMNNICIVYVDEPTCDVKHVYQIITKACSIGGEINKRVKLLFLGKKDESLFNEMLEYGADEINVFEVDMEDQAYDSQVYSTCYSYLVDEEPELILIPFTERSVMLAARISSRLNIGLIAECIDIKLDKTKIVFARTALNDAVTVNIVCTNNIFQMATVRKGVFQEKKTRKSTDGFIRFLVYHNKCREVFTSIEILNELQYEERERVNISEAKIIFGVGRGVKNKETIDRIKHLANLCNAELVGTRPLVENGMICHERQVGQSGISISPKLYIAFGISGMSQHIVGIRNAQKVIAINNNEKAPIFKYSDYAIVDDVDNIIKELEYLLNI